MLHLIIVFKGIVPLLEFMHLVFTCMPGESYSRWLRFLLLLSCTCDALQALINSTCMPGESYSRWLRFCCCCHVRVKPFKHWLTLLLCQVRVTLGGSGLCYRVHLLPFRHRLTLLFVDCSYLFRFTGIDKGTWNPSFAAWYSTMRLPSFCCVCAETSIFTV